MSAPPSDPPVPSDGIARGAGAFALGTLLSRVTGFVRDAAIVAVFPTARADIWILAWTLPNSLRRLVGEGAMTLSFVPLFGERLLQDGPEGARRFANKTFTVSALVLASLVAAGVAAMPGILWVITLRAPDWHEPAKFADAVELARWAFPYLWLIGLVAVAMGALQSLRRFFVPAVSQALLNISLILGALVFASRVETPLLALAWAALVGGVLQLVANLVALSRQGYRPRPDFALRDPHLGRLARLMAPAAFGASIHQVNLLVSRAFATSVGPGAVTWLYNASVLTDLPLGLFAVSMAVASLPALSEYAAQGDLDGYRRTLASALRRLLYLVFPAATGLFILAEPIISVFFLRGEFSAEGARASADALVLFSFGIPAVAASRLVVQGFYALQDTKTPVRVGIISVVTFVASALLLMPSFGHLGIALATSIAAFANLAANLFLLRRKTGRLGLTRVAGSVARSIAGCAALLPAAWGVARWGHWEAGVGGLDAVSLTNVAVLALAVLAGAAAYAAVTLALGSEEARDVLGAMKRRFGGAR